MQRSSPGVHFPPPLLFILGFTIGILLNRVWPLSLVATERSTIRLIPGWFFVGAGLLLLASAMLTFLRLRTAIYPNQPATTVVTHGPYRFSRNPMYVALTSAYFGFVLLTNALWPLLLLPVVLVVLQMVVIRREEHYLAGAFGAEYEEYCKRVRRWI
jgi:protein-S-isoprenylcysteine O-methyltransferase Ste14